MIDSHDSPQRREPDTAEPAVAAEAIVEYVTSWEERGIAKGLEKDRVEAWREMLLQELGLDSLP